MTTRPYLLAFALCVGVGVGAAVALALLLCGAPWHIQAVWGLGLGALVFAIAGAVGFDAENAYAGRKAEVELDEKQAKTALAWAQVDELRERLAAQSSPPPSDPPAPVRAAWNAANIILFTGGVAAGGFSQPKMAGMIASDAWQRWTDYYCAWPEGEPVLRRWPGKLGTVLDYHWPLTRILCAIAQGEFPTPPGPPPSVREYAPERRATERSEKGAGAVVVEGVVTGREG